MGDWADHLSTAFPDVRMKRYIEMRGADGGPWGRLCALPAFWVGLLYDTTAIDAAWDLVKGWTTEDREGLRQAVPRDGMAATVAGRGVREVALEVLEIARGGLNRRARLNAAGDNETGFLSPLQDIAESGRTPADDLLDAYHGRWAGDVTKVFAEYGY